MINFINSDSLKKLIIRFRYNIVVHFYRYFHSAQIYLLSSIPDIIVKTLFYNRSHCIHSNGLGECNVSTQFSQIIASKHRILLLCPAYLYRAQIMCRINGLVTAIK